MKPVVSLIWAMTDQRVIGIGNKLPWRLPADMQWFRQQTLGKPIVMGRKTFESFGARPLPGRTNIVITRDPHYFPEGVVVAHTLDDALRLAGNVPEIMVIGGASIYTQAFPLARRLYMTLVHAALSGDAWFPEFDRSAWREAVREDHAADAKNPHAYSFLILEPRNAG